MKTTPLKEKEKLFCLFYSESRNPRWSAVKAGYSLPTRHSLARLLSREEIKKEIARIDSKTKLTSEEVIAGYRRLAFGSVADALRLVCSDEAPSDEELEGMELFSISEIKRPKGGGLEIKFFDRLKALEHLEALSGTGNEDSAMPFYLALERSAAAVKGDADE